MDAFVVIEGYVGKDPEVRFSGRGDAVASFSVAVTKRVRNGDTWEDGPTTWWNVSAWKRLGELAGEHIRKGDRVVVAGEPELETYKGRDGMERQSLKITARNLGIVPRGPERRKNDAPPY